MVPLFLCLVGSPPVATAPSLALSAALDEGEEAGTDERALEFFWILVDVSGFGSYLLIIRRFLCFLV